MTDMLFKTAGDMCKHLHIYGGTYSLWWNSIPICDREIIPVLSRIRTGDHTPEDIQLLRTRLTSGIINPVQLRDAKFSSALYLMPRKEEYNTQRLLELAQTAPVYEFKAEHIILESRYLPHGVTSRDVPEQLIPKMTTTVLGFLYFKIGSGSPGHAQKKYHV